MGGTETKHRVVYTEAMVRDAVRSFVWRRVVLQQKSLWFAAAALSAYLMFLLWQGERGWLVGVLGAAVALPPLVLLGAWRVHSRHSLGRLRAMPAPEAWVGFDADGLAVQSGLGAARIPWSGFNEVWERPGYWMLFTDHAQFVTLPVGGFSAEELATLRERLRSAS